ncbi:uncharacterized protein LOC122963915 [Acropora millepora]|uniref:uncharacterized protein LOC122963915 n=1 Tax=Acropora millepora TaxID=45264 RepID=UPI001CF10707|nr:uncharacterized protein LOC122963915 [Acropora millepora]
MLKCILNQFQLRVFFLHRHTCKHTEFHHICICVAHKSNFNPVYIYSCISLFFLTHPICHIHLNIIICFFYTIQSVHTSFNAIISTSHTPAIQSSSVPEMVDLTTPPSGGAATRRYLTALAQAGGSYFDDSSDTDQGENPLLDQVNLDACAVGPDNDLSTSESEEETLPGKFYFLC